MKSLDALDASAVANVLHGHSANVWFAPQRWELIEGGVRLYPNYNECLFTDERIVIHDYREETLRVIAESAPNYPGKAGLFNVGLMGQVEGVVKNTAQVVVRRTGQGEVKGCQIELHPKADEPKALFSVITLGYGGKADWAVGWESNTIWKYTCTVVTAKSGLNLVMVALSDLAHGMTIDKGLDHQGRRTIVAIHDAVTTNHNGKPFLA